MSPDSTEAKQRQHHKMIVAAPNCSSGLTVWSLGRIFLCLAIISSTKLMILFLPKDPATQQTLDAPQDCTRHHSHKPNYIPSPLHDPHYSHSHRHKDQNVQRTPHTILHKLAGRISFLQLQSSCLGVHEDHSPSSSSGDHHDLNHTPRTFNDRPA